MDIEKKEVEEKYKKMVVPLGGWLLVEKDVPEEKMTCGLYRPLNTITQKLKYSMTGKLIAKSPFPPKECDWHREYWELLEIGDILGFNGTVPMLSPMPHKYEELIKTDERFICFHIADVICVICEEEYQQTEFYNRILLLNMNKNK